MLIKRVPAWFVPEREATDESVYRSRRRFLQDAALLTAASAALTLRAEPAKREVKRNERYTLDRPLTAELLAARHNIFDEFALERDKVWIAAKNFVTSPWKIHIGGQVKKQLTVDVSDLVRQFGLEERLYRHRCVETWAMAVPWIGFPLKKLVDLAEPLAKARYLRMVSFSSPQQAPGWYASRRVFPYYEALTLPEATHELAFLATGIYGHDLPPQHGAPIRLVVPWKYGFKSIKSIVAFQFTAERPGTFWNELSPDKYTFESNVNPTSKHPWPQDQETMLGSDTPRKTLPYNGYAELVKPLYA
jgi:methionine sulfoxide reductase catalytic subunit